MSPYFWFNTHLGRPPIFESLGISSIQHLWAQVPQASTYIIGATERNHPASVNHYKYKGIAPWYADMELTGNTTISLPYLGECPMN